PWTTIKFVDLPASSINIQYWLWDEDKYTDGNGELADVNPSKLKGFLDFNFDFSTHMLSGDLSGVHDFIPVSSVGEKGASGRSKVEFTVTSKTLAQVQLVPNKQMKGTV